jgi:hypothetical protein
MLSCNMCNNSMVTGHYDTDYTNVCCCFFKRWYACLLSIGAHVHRGTGTSHCGVATQSLVTNLLLLLLAPLTAVTVAAKTTAVAAAVAAAVTARASTLQEILVLAKGQYTALLVSGMVHLI